VFFVLVKETVSRGWRPNWSCSSGLSCDSSFVYVGGLGCHFGLVDGHGYYCDCSYGASCVNVP
jgi:hypothetical protein